jgi:1,4-dihydroxy-6-naphthoate synthase
MKLTLGFSPCPNDTFMFDAMVHQKIDTEGLNFEVVMQDVEALNKDAFDVKLDITKLSFNAFTHLTDHYSLLKSGSALGRNCGPLLVTKKGTVLNPKSKIAIPGKFTTANLLMKIAYPELSNKEEVLFSDIENLVLEDTFDAGLLIHENRFTYHQRGLCKIKDLGEFWEEKFQLPIPLGGIVVKKSISLDLQLKVQRVLKRSIEFAFSNPQESYSFVSEHAQEMSPDVMKKHIDLYVNSFSLDLGELGENAIHTLFSSLDLKPENIFVK